MINKRLTPHRVGFVLRYWPFFALLAFWTAAMVIAWVV